MARRQLRRPIFEVTQVTYLWDHAAINKLLNAWKIEEIQQIFPFCVLANLVYFKFCGI
jgi:hypothetical protein